MSNKTTKAGELAEDICHLHGLEQHVHIPTRGSNTLDLILCDIPGNVTVTGHPPLGASDHICLLAIIPAPALRERPTKRTVWRYQQADWDRLRHSYRTSDWEFCFTNNPDQSQLQYLASWQLCLAAKKLTRQGPKRLSSLWNIAGSIIQFDVDVWKWRD